MSRVRAPWDRQYPSARPRRRRRSAGLFGLLLAVIVLLFPLGCTGYVVALKSSEKTVTLTVEDKESVNKQDGHEYRVYTDRGVYVVADSLVFFNWRAADRYAELKVGKTYECKQAGWRVGFFSQFPNLIECDEVSGER